MEKSIINIGVMNAKRKAIAPEELKESLSLLEKEGYVPHDVHVENRRTGKMTTVSVLAKPEAE